MRRERRGAKREKGRERERSCRGDRDHVRGLEHVWPNVKVRENVREREGNQERETWAKGKKEEEPGGCRSRAREFGTEYVSWDVRSLVRRCSGREGCRPKRGNRGTPCHFDCLEVKGRKEGARGKQGRNRGAVGSRTRKIFVEGKLEESLAVWSCPKEDKPSGVVRRKRNPRRERKGAEAEIAWNRGGRVGSVLGCVVPFGKARTEASLKSGERNG